MNKSIIASYAVALIVTIVLGLFSVHTVKSTNPVYHKCVESGLGFRRHHIMGNRYTINYILETQTGVSCADTTTKDVLELALKESFDTLARLGTDVGSVQFRHPDGWQTYMTIKQVINEGVVGIHTTETSDGIIVWDYCPSSYLESFKH